MAWTIVYSILFFIFIVVGVLKFRRSRRSKRELQELLAESEQVCQKAETTLAKWE